MIGSIVRTCSPTLHITPGPGHPLIFNDDVGDDDDDDGDGDDDMRPSIYAQPLTR